MFWTMSRSAGADIQPMERTTVDAKWCHLVIRTARRRAVFKLAAHAAFCERALTDIIGRAGWGMDAARVHPSSINILLRVPIDTGLSATAKRLRTELATQLREAGIGPHRLQRMFERQYWGVVLKTGAAATRLKHHLNRRGDGLVGQHPARSAHHIVHLGQNEILQSGRVRDGRVMSRHPLDRRIQPFES
jgi:REP element-mobilizing transposase RayT